MAKTGRVTGIGGVFLRFANPELLCRWYQEHLGIEFGGNPYCSFLWESLPGQAPGRTEFAIMKDDSPYFNPSATQVMLNFRVDNLDALLMKLRSSGIDTVGGPETHAYGKFAWIIDPAGNKIELWEAADDGF